jgi:AhpC/TSA family protein
MSAPGPPRPPAGTSRYTWIVGVLVVLGLAYITLNTLGTEKPGSRGVPNGRKLPPFAVPIATSKLKGDAQVDPSKACKVRGSDVLNSCQLAERGPVALAFVATRSKQCDRQVDALERVRADYPGVSFAAVAIRGDRDDIRRVIRERGWKLPVAYDHDGGVANAYAVAICPTVTFAYRGGKVEGTSLSLLDGAELRARLDKLMQGPPG